MAPKCWIDQLCLVIFTLSGTDQVQSASLHQRALVINCALFNRHVLVVLLGVHFAATLRTLDTARRLTDFVSRLTSIAVPSDTVALVRVGVDRRLIIGSPLESGDGEALVQALGLARDSRSFLIDQVQAFRSDLRAAGGASSPVVDARRPSSFVRGGVPRDPA